MRLTKCWIVLCVAVFLAGCADSSRMGMVRDAKTGLQFGSQIEHNIFIDPSQFRNKAIKITTRNVSGDQAYQLSSFNKDLYNAFSSKGYVPTTSDSFGIKLDINVLYSGQIQQNMASQFAFLGGAAGGISGYRSDTRAGTATGVLVGATLGSILGSYVTDDTYVIVAEVSFGVTDSIGDAQTDKKTITFGSSPQLQEENIPTNYKPFREVLRTKIAVFAGGRNVSQQQIAEQVKQRLISIVSDSI